MPSFQQAIPVKKGRKRKKKGRKKKKKGRKRKKKGRKRVRIPADAAIMVVAPNGKETDIMRTMVSKISLAEIGIGDGLKAKTLMSGAFLLEIPGKDGSQKADQLMEKMREVLKESGKQEEVRLLRPQKKEELRLSGILPGTTAEDISAAIAQVGQCKTENIRVGTVRESVFRGRSVWVQCPAAAAAKIIGGGSFLVGWTKVKVEKLDARPIQCFKCLEWGHIRFMCKKSLDLAGTCFRCGESGHMVKECLAATPKCVVCARMSLKANHRMGGKSCPKPSCRAGVAAAKKKEGEALKRKRKVPGDTVKGDSVNARARVSAPYGNSSH